MRFYPWNIFKIFNSKGILNTFTGKLVLGTNPVPNANILRAGGSILVDTNITASGTISSSAAITALQLNTKGIYLGGAAADKYFAREASGVATIAIDGGGITNVLINAPLTASSAISSSAGVSFISTLSNKRIQEDITNSGGAVTNTLINNSTTDPSNKVLAIAAGNDSNNVIMTLPSPEAGLSYTFLSSAAPGACTVDIKAGASNLLFGIAICDDGNEDITGTTFRFANEKFIRGTRVECLSDGLGWSIQAYCLCDLADVSTS